MDGRADVVPHARNGQLGGAGAATASVRSLVHVDFEPGPGQDQRGRQPVRSRAYDDDVHPITADSLPRSTGTVWSCPPSANLASYTPIIPLRFRSTTTTCTCRSTSGGPQSLVR